MRRHTKIEIGPTDISVALWELPSITETPSGGSTFYRLVVLFCRWAALPNNRLETLIGSQANYEIKTEIKMTKIFAVYLQA